jgi:pimeloyl-ACP methyl ester carboxylesterase
MATATLRGQEGLDGLTLAYELHGDSGRPWAITPGGRFTKDDPGMRELAEAIVAGGNRVLIWDRPNCGESDVCFAGVTESDLQADTLAGLLRHLDLAPAVLVGWSGGARVSLLTAANHPDVAAGLAVLWVSGGVFGLMSLATHYCAGSVQAAWVGGMEAVVELPEWAEVLERNPGNRQRFLDQDRAEFIETMERWMLAYCPREGQHVPGLPDDLARAIGVPALVFRSGVSDAFHTRATSEALAELIPNAQLVEPPWPDTEWVDNQRRIAEGRQAGLFSNGPRLAPQLLAWAGENLG